MTIFILALISIKLTALAFCLYMRDKQIRKQFDRLEAATVEKMCALPEAEVELGEELIANALPVQRILNAIEGLSQDQFEELGMRIEALARRCGWRKYLAPFEDTEPRPKKKKSTRIETVMLEEPTCCPICGSRTRTLVTDGTAGACDLECLEKERKHLAL